MEALYAAISCDVIPGEALIQLLGHQEVRCPKVAVIIYYFGDPPSKMIVALETPTKVRMID